MVNKGGGGGSIGTGEVARAAPDGYTLLMGTTGNVVLNPLTMSLNFDPARELTPVAVVGFVPFAVAVWPGLNVNSVKELVALVKASPGKYSYGTNGPAGIIHLITELFSRKADLKMVAVPYPGGITVQQDLISGRIQIYFDAFNSALRFHKTGQVKVLATTGGTRMAAAPDIPTVEEAGTPDYVAETAFILMAPAGTAGPGDRAPAGGHAEGRRRAGVPEGTRGDGGAPGARLESEGCGRVHPHGARQVDADRALGEGRQLRRRPLMHVSSPASQ